MGIIQQRISAFTKLGAFLSQFSQNKIVKKENIEFNDLFFDGFKHQIKIAQEHNSWFTKDNILFSIENWSKALNEKDLTTWVSTETLGKNPSKKIAIIMAGNIPLVGFHDFLAVLISGHNVVVKQSSNDEHLLPFLAKYLEYVAPSLKGNILFTKDKLTNFDAVIATGSNNTARYFEYYFKDKPSIIRKNRNSCAIITGNETAEDFKNLSEDIFRYFGLGCRNVSKLFIPKGYNFDPFFKGMFHQQEIINNAKYANNYDYNKAVYLMSEFDILENGFLMIKEDQSYSSPIASIFYEYYDNIDNLKIKLYEEREKIQCVVANNFIENEIPFGQTQHPKLSDYADGVNTLKFLSEL
ncbi:acyl-CoA reductase [Tenacibaculum maritimum]|uniref:acyl-CoA reductase n=1 Tax=Tenacibaculum maritimum TaxID=107401 RepID=UPI00041602F5|nr:acyl-CoA reductase [Tenacibaculum maritimum]MCD9585813.1 acyl-CoA reductase [Tenacibaculum maritimum]MCD9611754.1 acyl-CoA reductase [Tenacibaculum maritimum]MCD9621794.1 acyl-CoA reductase [Tenacibaculum maritimum]MCD9628115.1 acyl-CoA reductase [Tenacibaculum maritimum]MCD9630870.1 acyl-CoA reductase [Tenacibaculum maritimum]